MVNFTRNPLVILSAIALMALPVAIATQSHAAPSDAVQVVQGSTAPQRIAQANRTQRIRFARGANGATIQTSVVRGERDVYLLGAKQGQRMTIKLTSVEGNAVVAIAAPLVSGGKERILKQDATTWTGTLPATGDYRLIVGSTRGNASYRLQVTIQ
jgi:hypothetical protein